MNSASENATQTEYESSYLSAKIEEMIYRYKTVLEDEHEEVSKNRKHDFRKNNLIDPGIILLNRSKYIYILIIYIYIYIYCKYFTQMNLIFF